MRTKRTHRVATTDAELSAALKRAQGYAARDRRVVRARYDRSGDSIALHFADGARLSLPRRLLQGLEDATPAEVADIRILGSGTGLHWPRLDVDHYVLGLLDAVYGTRRWMATVGRAGGSSRSKAKAAAARRNGLKGGRPKKKTA